MALAAQPKIINGEVGDLEAWTEAGALLLESGGTPTWGCSSSLIAPDVVLTAAHCVDPAVVGYEPEAVWFSKDVDQNTTDATTSENAYRGSNWVLHGSWAYAELQVGLALNYDIALVFLDEAHEDTPLAVVPTAEEMAQLVLDAPVVIVGWGQQGSGESGVKQVADSFVAEVAEYEFKVGEEVADSRKCYGDSGGPSFMAVESDALTPWRVVGVTSHTYDNYGCDNTGGVDTRVDFYLDWLDDEMTKACEDGVRAWCEEPGLLPPPRPRTPEELVEDLQLVGCASAPGALSALAALAGLAAVARRRR